VEREKEQEEMAKESWQDLRYREERTGGGTDDREVSLGKVEG
jgi:hypothetical protein